ncbi:uncharacterized protein PFL1_01869 [Pseudozyma flocculosa PF-1]|uniref:Transcription initiation factor TFIID subunit 2 n=1 Tax=Pseudozyma flocculosa TaxID=84751 RepID=A0A5C3EZB3_9BASI|nr:uncharacterized protein PFL1_01869 [Pseudozyma flocculosa PF-1]EPQ30343.1 hypothetical protein PFL1_01869 [Pseudozyma flocculosa PF-1]SPO37412.1 related to TAF2 - component of TFIID complex [Pseudozyma flocculosa]
MQRANAASRGYTLSHQRVVLDLGFGGTIAGFTELTIIPTDRNLRVVHLNCRQAVIQSISCAGIEADYSYNDHITGVGLSDNRDVHLYPELKRKIFAAASDGVTGELSVLLPPEIHIQPQSIGGGPRAGSAVPEDAPTPGGSGSGGGLEYTPITVRIEYYLKDPADGVQFVRPTADSPYRVPHLFTVASCPDAARCWIPCVDSLWERCTWEFELVVPKYLASADGDNDGDGNGNEGGGEDGLAVPDVAGLEDSQVVVVCTGDLMEQVAHPNNSSKTVFCFTQPVPTSVQHVGFAAGPFQMIRIDSIGHQAGGSGAPQPATAIEEAGQPEMLAFCLPGREDELRNSVGFTRQAMDFFARGFGSYPFGSFRLVMVDEPPQDCTPLSMLAICSSDLLHPPSVIDQALENRQILSHAIAFQWVGINIVQATWADTWLINGLGLYITGLFIRKLLGNNEYRFRLKKDCDRVCAWDVGMPPLYMAGAWEPPDAATLPFINLKAPLVLHILDRRLCKMGASLGLGRVIPKVFLQAMTGEMTNNALSTQNFLRVCRKVSGADLRQFTEQWIRGSGCPRFFCSANFNRKKLLIEMHIRQETPAAQYAAARPEDALASNPVPLFEGQLTVRIHEADGTPYEHVLDVKGPAKRYEVPFNTKYKRVRRNTKRFQARQAAAAAAAQGDQDAAEAIGLIDLGFGLGMWEDERAREEWRVADWTEDDEEKMASAPYEWIRMDADFEWLASIHFEQPDYMWVSQLQRDRDVVAQVAAVHALAQMPSLVTCSMLTRTVLVSKYFYRVRAEAAHALVSCAMPELDYLGLFHLLKLFRTQCCYDPPDDPAITNPLDVPCIPRANDFSDASEYFLQRAIIHAISRVRNPKGRSPPQVKKFLINLLRYNDNSTNRFVDDFYLASIMDGLASAFVPVDSVGGFVPADEDEDARDDDALLAHAAAEVERLQELDKLVPSYHNVITLGALDWQAAMMLANLRPRDLQLFFFYTRQGNFGPVRIAALNYLLLLGSLDHKVVARYCFALLRSDESRSVKRALARALCEGLAVAISTGVFGGGGIRGPEALLIEENGGQISQSNKGRDAQLEAALKSLRREIGRSAGVREGFLAALLAPGLDSEARWSMLKLAELLFRPAEERDLPLQPKVQLRVRMPSLATQTAEQPLESPSVSKIKLVKQPSIIEGAAAAAPAPPAATATATPAKPSAPRVAFETPEGAAAASAGPSASKPPKPVKAKKPKPLAPGQASGMSYADLTACRNTLKKLMDNRFASIFLKPVDPVRDQATNYFDVIKNPMDLGSIANKLDSGQYRDRYDFKADFELMIRNARTYTPDPKAWAHQQAVGLEKAFNQLWTRMEKTLEQSAAKQQRVANGVSGTNAAAASDTTVKATDYGTTAADQAGSPGTHPVRDQPDPVHAPPAAVPAPGRLSVKVKLKAKPPLANEAPPKPVLKPTVAASPAAESPDPAQPKPKKPLIKLKKKESESSSSSPAPSAAAPVPAPQGEASRSASAVPRQSVDDDILDLLGESPEPASKKATPAPVVKLKKADKESGSARAATPSKKPNKPAGASLAGSPAPLAATSALNGGAAPLPHVPPPPKAATPSPSKPGAKGADSDPVAAAAASGLPLQAKKCKALIQTLRKSPFSIFFLYPVDPVRDGVPTYLDEIKTPMDLSTMEKKVNQGAYRTMADFAADMQLIFANCRQFNPPTTEPCLHADELEKLFRKEWAKLLVKRLEFGEKRALQGLLNRVKANPASILFREPVDPVALGIPTYFDVIPRRDARDLSLIESKLKGDKYDSIDAFDADVRLMLRNCYTFNAADQGIVDLTKTFESIYRKEINGVKASCGHSTGGGGGGGSGQKRKEAVPGSEGGGGGGAAGGSSSKKTKLA